MTGIEFLNLKKVSNDIPEKAAIYRTHRCLYKSAHRPDRRQDVVSERRPAVVRAQSILLSYVCHS